MYWDFLWRVQAGAQAALVHRGPAIQTDGRRSFFLPRGLFLSGGDILGPGGRFLSQMWGVLARKGEG